MRRSSVPSSQGSLPADLVSSIERAGYYPALVGDVVAHALGEGSVRASLVHQSTTFDHDAVRRHINVLVVTDTTLIIVHADDHDGHPGEAPVATATSESIPLSAVRGVMVTHVVPDPRNYVPGSLGRDITLTVGWGTVSRVDLMPATCGDPACDADHGYDGTVTADDLALRVSADADGEDVVRSALALAQVLAAATGQSGFGQAGSGQSGAQQSGAQQSALR